MMEKQTFVIKKSRQRSVIHASTWIITKSIGNLIGIINGRKKATTMPARQARVRKNTKKCWKETLNSARVGSRLKTLKNLKSDSLKRNFFSRLRLSTMNFNELRIGCERLWPDGGLGSVSVCMESESNQTLIYTISASVWKRNRWSGSICR